MTILIVEPNVYFALGFTQGLLTHFNGLGEQVLLTRTLTDKDHADLVFLAAEQESAQLRYLTQRNTAPPHQHIFIFKEKPEHSDKARFRHLDGIIYRHQSLGLAMQMVTLGLQGLSLATVRPPLPMPRRVPLTVREKDILLRLAKGQRSCDISSTLHISPKTVSGHKRNAMGKLGFSRSPDLNYWLLNGGLGQLTPDLC
ncbi:helix-turn-helix transcriptional regulator [Serratia fonticola]